MIPYGLPLIECFRLSAPGIPFAVPAEPASGIAIADWIRDRTAAPSEMHKTVLSTPRPPQALARHKHPINSCLRVIFLIETTYAKSICQPTGGHSSPGGLRLIALLAGIASIIGFFIFRAYPLREDALAARTLSDSH